MTLVVHVEEEYGYRDYLWFYPGNEKELIQDWELRRRPVTFWGPTSCSRGKLIEIGRKFDKDGVGKGLHRSIPFELVACDDDVCRARGGPCGDCNNWRRPIPGIKNMSSKYIDAYAHVHMSDDTYLVIGGRTFRDASPERSGFSKGDVVALTRTGEVGVCTGSAYETAYVVATDERPALFSIMVRVKFPEGLGLSGVWPIRYLKHVDPLSALANQAE